MIKLTKKYFLSADEYQYIVSEKSGKNKKTGKDIYSLIFVVPTIESLIKRLMEEQIKRAVKDANGNIENFKKLSTDYLLELVNELPPELSFEIHIDFPHSREETIKKLKEKLNV